MANIKDEQFDKIVDLFEDQFELPGLADFYKNPSQSYDFMISILNGEGFDIEAFPDEAHLNRLDYEIRPISQLPYSDWAELYIEEYGLSEKTSEEVETFINDHDIFEYIVNHDDANVSIDVEIMDTPATFERHSPSLDQFYDAVISVYDESELIRYAKEEQHYLNGILEDIADEEGFDNIDVSQLRYEIKGVEYKGSFEDVNEGIYEHLDDYEMGDSFVLSTYIHSDEMYDDILVNTDFDIVILDNPEDFENE